MIMEKGIYQIEVPISAVFAVEPWKSVDISTGTKELMVDGQLANVGIGIVLPIRASFLATGAPVLTCTETSPVVSQIDEFCDKVFICDDSRVDRGFAKKRFS